MGEIQHKNTRYLSFYTSNLVWTIAGMALRYIFFSILISLMFDDTLLWTIANGMFHGSRAYKHIALSGRVRLRKRFRFTLWWKRLVGIKLKEEEQKAVEEYEEIRLHEASFVFKKKAWLGLLAPVLGSLFLQLIYFTDPFGLPPPYIIALLIGNSLNVLFFSFLGALITRIRLRKLARQDAEKVKQKESRKRAEAAAKRVLSSFVLVIFLSVQFLVAPASIGGVKAICSAPEEMNSEEFIGTYDPDCEYEVRGEPKDIDTKERIPKDKQQENQTGSEYQLPENPDELPSLTEEEKIQLKESCAATSGCSYEELEIQYRTFKHLYETGQITVPSPNVDDISVWDALMIGIGGVAEDGKPLIQRDLENAGKYAKENWNKPWKWAEDYNNFQNERNKARLEGGHDSLKGKWDGMMNFLGEFSKDPVGKTQKAVEPAWNFMTDYGEYARNNGKVVSPSADPIGFLWNLPGAVEYSLDKRYEGGSKQAMRDVKTALADKNTYYNLLPISDTTKQLYVDGKYAQALGRAEAEVTVEAGIVVAEVYTGRVVLTKVPAIAGVFHKVGSVTSKSKKTKSLLTNVANTKIKNINSVDELAFSQKTAKSTFKNGKFKNQSVGSVADGLKGGTIKPEEIPVDIIKRDGQILVLNTRSSLALRRAQIPVDQWVINDVSGNDLLEEVLTQRLLNNKLRSEGIDVVRITGKGSNVSNLE